MQLTTLAEVSESVAATRSRRRKIALLSALLAEAPPGEIRVCVQYLSGQLPQGRIGVGPSLVREALDRAPADRVTLTLEDVDRCFSALAGCSGSGSQRRRRALLAELFDAATTPEQRFLAQLLLGELRQGALAAVMAESIATAADLPAARLRKAVMVAGDAAPVAEAVLTDGSAALARFRLVPLSPVQPMLAQPGGTLEEALAGAGEVCLEYKLDGARIQVHRDGDDVRVFSRRLHDVTASVPEIAEAAAALPSSRFVLDGEALALRDDGRPQPFQVTMARFGRRRDVGASRREQPLTPYFFDCLHLEGEDLLDAPLGTRLERLTTLLPDTLSVRRLVTGEEGPQRTFAQQALDAGHEGVMVKDLGAAYAAGSRGGAWLKVKPAHTLDLVVLAAEWGHGRRRGWLSNLHLGARDEATGRFLMLGKTFKGMTDRMLDWQTRTLRELAVSESQGVVTVRPELVVEVAFDGIQRSPHYPAGLALRFARLKGYRTDKAPQTADSIAAVRAIFQRQTDAPA
ncbi:ATP-dependent DNA ligase [Ectothiorhodospiraceae bacterium WFHF3C12]|nr:ATP-dependent DNA ligase [Ectothiorhodospiraceae bacterium WFHF3C12]